MCVTKPAGTFLKLEVHDYCAALFDDTSLYISCFQLYPDPAD